MLCKEITKRDCRTCKDDEILGKNVHAILTLLKTCLYTGETQIHKENEHRRDCEEAEEG